MFHRRQSAAAPKVNPASKAHPAAEGKNAFPPQLLIYYAGKRTIYLAMLKLYTVLLFSYTTTLVAPQLLRTDHSDLLEKMRLPRDLPRWVLPAAAVIGGGIPMAFVTWLSPPYVTHMYLSLPPWARYSKQHVLKYLQALPKDAELKVATIRWFGRPRLVRMKLGELKLGRERWGCVNTIAPSGREKFWIDWRRSPARVPVEEATGLVGKALAATVR